MEVDIDVDMEIDREIDMDMEMGFLLVIDGSDIYAYIPL
jgi:hypothetical protein